MPMFCPVYGNCIQPKRCDRGAPCPPIDKDPK